MRSSGCCDRTKAGCIAFGMRLCQHPEDAEDILQDTLLSVARSIHQYRGAAAFSTWLFTIVRSHCFKKRRRSKYAPDRDHSLEREAMADALEITDPGATPDEQLLQQNLREALDAAIDQLPVDQREVLILRDVDGLPASEVADVVGISVPAVKSRLHRARLRLRKLLAPRLGVSSTTAADGSCRDVLTLYSRHLEGEIGADLCAEMERHLKSCERCRVDCDSLKEMLALCRQTAPAPVPPAVQRSVVTALRQVLDTAH